MSRLFSTDACALWNDEPSALNHRTPTHLSKRRRQKGVPWSRRRRRRARGQPPVARASEAVSTARAQCLLEWDRPTTAARTSVPTWPNPPCSADPADASLHQRLSRLLRLASVSLSSRDEYAVLERETAALWHDLHTHALPSPLRATALSVLEQLQRHDFLGANQAYLHVAVGQQHWPIGLSDVGIHARTAAERLREEHIIHPMADDTFRRRMHTLKRLIDVAERAMRSPAQQHESPQNPSGMGSTAA